VSQTVLKTAAANNRVRFDSVAFRQFIADFRLPISDWSTRPEDSCPRNNSAIGTWQSEMLGGVA